ncbi:tetratricopeptide repeat protein, partial [Paracoccaceae bacterium]|nr:tetratricopeptide repeat protein [Paracoccaceae bacterium]
AQDLPKEQLQNLITLYNQGQYKESLNKGFQLLEQFPNLIILYNIIGAANKGLGKLEEAIEAYNKAISLKPDYAEAYNNMGVALKAQSKLEEAIEAYKKALSIKPDFAAAYNNMGNAFKEQGKLDEAIEAHSKALTIKPDFAAAYSDMGVALKAQSKLGEAIKAYNKALSIKPDYAEAYFNMGNTLKQQGKLEGAIDAYTKALSIKPNYSDAHNNMGNTLIDVIFTKPNRDIQKAIVSVLDSRTYARPMDIARASVSLLKFEPNLQKYLQVADNEVIQNALDIISDLSKLSLLLKLMSVCPLPDLEIEKLFKNLRRAILTNILDINYAPPELLKFQSALALQCFTNEYIYSQTKEEEKILQSLDASVRKTLRSNEQPGPQVILAFASYKALNEYDWHKLLDVTDHIKDVFVRQIEEPNQEKKLKIDIPVLGEITDKVSSEVRAQYEESPYPRWVNLGLSLRPMTTSEVFDIIKLKLHDTKITEVEKPEILIAGCGTGQHSIGTAARFKSSKVLAIDLSLSSLAYARRKTDELGIGNINYMHADILDLVKLNKQFDIIESAGVLHHMKNPMAGWKVLVDCLKPGGLMKIGLYSEIARQHIVEIKKEISNAGISSSDATMTSFRSTMIISNQNHHKQILDSGDFYSLSTLRDLLFHVQEHRFTIRQLKHCICDLGLKFCGFEGKKIVSHFKQTNIYKDNVYDLDKWQSYEKANPQAFAGMYQFWCQKIH